MYRRAGPFFTRHQLHYIVPLPVPTVRAPLLLSFPSHTVCGACDPFPEHVQPQGFDSMAVTTSEPFACVLVLHPAPGPRGLMLPVVLFTAARKENCLPLKMLPVKKWRRVRRRLRRSLRPPGPPAVVQSRGNGHAQVLPGPHSGHGCHLLGTGREVGIWAHGDQEGAVHNRPDAFKGLLNTAALSRSLRNWAAVLRNQKQVSPCTPETKNQPVFGDSVTPLPLAL